MDEDATCSTMTFGADDEYYQELIDATEGLADGTIVETPVEVSSGYYVVKLVTQLDREATDTEKESIVNQRKDDRLEELYTEWEENGTVSPDEEVLAKIVFNFSLTQYYEAETEAASEEATEAVSEAEAETETETEAAVTESAETETETAAAEAETDAAAETESEAVTE